MPASTSEVGRAFWGGRAASGSSVSSSGDKLFSYATIILQRLPNGQTIGNVTKYSPTTSKHQSQVGVRRANKLTKMPVPGGATDLVMYI